ncbi:MAG: malate transporter [Synechococcaceae cyanobacterium]|nr:malate transporter [Synechococcaceae cyanobacterium]
MLRFAIELLPCLLLGVVLARWRPDLPARLAAPLVHWGVPISMVGLLLRAGLNRELLMAALLAGLASGGGLALIHLLPPLRRHLGAGSLKLGSVVGNTAYWGLPAALALLPAAAIAHAISYDLVGTLVTWSVGPSLVEGRAARPRALLRALLESPASRGLLLALALQITPWSTRLAGLLWWPARAVLLVALVLVGMRLGLMFERSGGGGPAPGLALALAIKLLVLPALLLAVTAPLPLPELVGDAVVLQAAAPTAISVLLIGEAAQARGRPGEAEPAAALVLWSTLAALVTVPLWGGVLRWLPPG